MKCKLNAAIDLAYELIKQEWLNSGKHNMNLAVALDQLEPYYKQPWKTHDEERKAYWVEMMDLLLDERFSRFTEEEIDKMTACLIKGEEDSLDLVSDKIYDAAICCGLGDKIYWED